MVELGSGRRGNAEQRNGDVSRGGGVLYRPPCGARSSGVFPWLTTMRSRRSREQRKGGEVRAEIQMKGSEGGVIRRSAASYAAVGGVLCGHWRSSVRAEEERTRK
jgi:hypothetical protein